MSDWKETCVDQILPILKEGFALNLDEACKAVIFSALVKAEATGHLNGLREAKEIRK